MHDNNNDDDKKSKKQKRVVCVSAPGKILLSGGYLVLDPSNAGLVLAVDKRFYTTAEGTFVQAQPTCTSKDSSSSSDSSLMMMIITIQVVSPQFGEEYAFQYDTTTCQLKQTSTCAVTASSSSSTPPHVRNEFVEKTLQVCFLYYNDTLLQHDRLRLSHIRLTIQGDNEFWSHPENLLSSTQPPPLCTTTTIPSSTTSTSTAPDSHTNIIDNRLQHKSFLPAPRDAATGKICKTGLGSSACLVTSLVAALDHLFLPLPSSSSLFSKPSTDTDQTSVVDAMSRNVVRMERISNLAQLCHCVAQGKIGSGFDVSAACWGSHIFQKQQQSTLLEQVMAALSSSSLSSSSSSSSTCNSVATTCILKQLVDEPWTKACVLHPLFQFSASTTTNNSSCTDTTTRSRGSKNNGILQVLLADTAHGGSSSPSLSKLVLQQQKHSPIWNELVQINQQIIHVWLQIQSLTTTTTPFSQLDQEAEQGQQNDMQEEQRQQQQHEQRIASISEEELHFLATTVASEWNKKTWTSPTTSDHEDDERHSFSEPHASSENHGTHLSPPLSLSNLLYQLHCLFLEWRHTFKAMGVQTKISGGGGGGGEQGVELEPDVQTVLADATQQLPGVVAAVVPGAGGYDALACIYIDSNNKDNDVREQVCEFWRSRSQPQQATEGFATAATGGAGLRITPLHVRAVPYGEGVRLEFSRTTSANDDE